MFLYHSGIWVVESEFQMDHGRRMILLNHPHCQISIEYWKLWQSLHLFYPLTWDRSQYNQKIYPVLPQPMQLRQYLKPLMTLNINLVKLTLNYMDWLYKQLLENLYYLFYDLVHMILLQIHDLLHQIPQLSH